VDRVVATRNRGRAHPQFLVKWRGLEYSDATWEEEEEVVVVDKLGAVSRDGVGLGGLGVEKQQVVGLVPRG
jgi:hypothetical protein